MARGCDGSPTSLSLLSLSALQRGTQTAGLVWLQTPHHCYMPDFPSTHRHDLLAKGTGMRSMCAQAQGFRHAACRCSGPSASSGRERLRPRVLSMACSTPRGVRRRAAPTPVLCLLALKAHIPAGTRRVQMQVSAGQCNSWQLHKDKCKASGGGRTCRHLGFSTTCGRRLQPPQEARENKPYEVMTNPRPASKCPSAVA